MTRQWIVVTRPEDKKQDEQVSRHLEVRNFPVTQLKRLPFEPQEFTDFGPDVVVFTSTVAADIIGESQIAFKEGTEFVAIGRKTADALKRMGIDPIVPEIMTSEGVIDLISGRFSNQRRIALMSSDKSNGAIENYLRKAGYQERTFTLYDSIPLPIDGLRPLIDSLDCFGIIITSSYEARIVFGPSGIAKDSIRPDLHVFAIGDVTRRTLREIGMMVSEPFGESDIAGLIRNIERTYFDGR